MKWKMVPTEPTKEMYADSAKHTDSRHECPECGHITEPDIHTAYSRAYFAYTEMLAAAPSPWIKITDDPASLPKEEDADSNGMVLWLTSSRIISGHWRSGIEMRDGHGSTHWCPMIPGPEGE